MRGPAYSLPGDYRVGPCGWISMGWQTDEPYSRHASRLNCVTRSAPTVLANGLGSADATLRIEMSTTH